MRGIEKHVALLGDHDRGNAEKGGSTFGEPGVVGGAEAEDGAERAVDARSRRGDGIGNIDLEHDIVAGQQIAGEIEIYRHFKDGKRAMGGGIDGGPTWRCPAATEAPRSFAR